MLRIKLICAKSFHYNVDAAEETSRLSVTILISIMTFFITTNSNAVYVNYRMLSALLSSIILKQWFQNMIFKKKVHI